MKATTLAKFDNKCREWITSNLSPSAIVPIYSLGRKYFLSELAKDIPETTYVPPKGLSRTLWGIKFRSPIMNAAGMDKGCTLYEVMAKQGAGAHIIGTTTWTSRDGNIQDLINIPLIKDINALQYWAFTPYPQSGSSSNWMGLPNKSDRIIASKASDIGRISNTPLGASIMGDPSLQGEDKLNGIVNGMIYYDYANVDFIEWNVSCPNVKHGDSEYDTLKYQVEYVKRRYLDRRIKNNIPLIVKLSNDTNVKDVPEILNLLLENGIHGVNFGNTSTQYNSIREKIHPAERKLFDYYTKKYGGGISGKPLKEKSLELCATAIDYIKAGGPGREFNVIRTGGIDSPEDIIESERIGVKLNQWFTGYFEGFSKHGHDVYRKFYESTNFRP